MLRLAFDFIITWRETRTRPNAYFPREKRICLPECWMGDIRRNDYYSVPNYQAKMCQITKRYEIDV